MPILIDPAPAPATKSPRLTAVTYQRVAAVRDADRAEGGEGPATLGQRETNQRRAAELGATVLAEFTDAGQSGLTADRSGLRRMLGYVGANDVTYCIVSSIDRLSRDMNLAREIRDVLVRAGATLVTRDERSDDASPNALSHGVELALAGFSAAHPRASLPTMPTQVRGRTKGMTP